MKTLTLFVCNLFYTAVIEAMPAQVIIIRHAEKPVVGNELSPEGQRRAAGLPVFFTKDREVLQFGLPVAIYAPRPGREDASVRSIQTITPLAAVLKLPIHSEYKHKQYLQMVEEVKSNPAYAGKTVLICWEHHVIPEIAHAFGAADVPLKWHGDVFDRVWLLTFMPDGRIAFKETAERL